MRCEARTRFGSLCRAFVMPGRNRCRHHGGVGNGPTGEARERQKAGARAWAIARRAANKLIGKHTF